ncbi:MAG: putative porin [Limisphaerales bacterium]
MKKNKKQTPFSKITLFAGATALMAFTPQIHAQSSVDALLNKLEQKGVLTVDEADQLKAENAKDSAADFDKALSSKFPMPDWVTSYKLSGDFRGRFDDQTGNDALVSRIRLRYRLRVGLQVNMKDNFQIGFSLGSDDAASASNPTGGTPTSNNSTFLGNGSKKFIFVNTAYAKWTPIKNDDGCLSGLFGKMSQPFDVSWMLFDPDYTPEGGVLQSSYKFSDSQSLRFNSGAFVLDEVSGSSRDPFMYGGQMIWDAKWTPHLASSLGVSTFDIVKKQKVKTTYDGNSGNTLVGGAFANNFNPIIGSGSVIYTLDSFPLYNGAFPIKFAGEYMDNPGASHNNEGWNASVMFGKAGKKGNWDISYRYQRLEADAWWDQVENDDNLAYSPVAFNGAGPGVVSGTNVKGHLIAFDYSITEALTFTFTCYVNSLINNPSPASSDAIHAMADIMWKF